MTDDTTTEATAAAELAALARAAFDGEPVTAAQLVEAREKVTLAALAARGRDERAQAAREAEAAENRAQAKREAAGLMADTDAPLAAAIVAFTAALGDVLSAASKHDDRVREVARLYTDVGVVSPNFGAIDAFDVPDLDRANFVFTDYGTLRAVTVDGREHLLKHNPRVLALSAVNDALRAHDLPVINTSELR